MKLSKTFIVLLLLSCVQLQGQSLTEPQSVFLNTVAQRYQNANAYSIEVKVSTYDATGNLIGSVQEHLAAKQGNQYLTETPMLTVLFGTDFQLFINHLERLIQFSPLNKDARSELINEQMKMDFSLASFEGIELEYIETDTEVIVQPLVQFYGADVKYKFDKEQQVLEQVEYTYNTTILGQPQKVLIEYQNFQFDEAVDASLFQLNQYIVEQGDDWKSVGVFADYQLIKPQTNEE